MSFETRDGMRGADGGTASFLRIEKALLGELDAVEKARFEADLETDPVLRARYHEARARTSPLSWEKVRAALPDPSGIAPRPEARRAPARAGRGERALAWLDRVLPRFPRPALALGGCLLLLLALLPFTGRDAGFRAKGGAKPQVALEVDGVRVPPGDTYPVKSGAILTFAYRSPGPLFVQIWYSEDGSAPGRFDGKGEDDLRWPAHPDWTYAPQRIQLDGAWKSQRVIIVTSSRPLGPSRAASLAAGRHARGEASVFTFELGQP